MANAEMTGTLQGTQLCAYLVVGEAVRQEKEAHRDPLTNWYGEPKGCIKTLQRGVQALNQLFKHAPAQDLTLFNKHTHHVRQGFKYIYKCVSPRQ